MGGVCGGWWRWLSGKSVDCSYRGPTFKLFVSTPVRLLTNLSTGLQGDLRPPVSAGTCIHVNVLTPIHRHTHAEDA